MTAEINELKKLASRVQQNGVTSLASKELLKVAAQARLMSMIAIVRKSS